MSAREEHAYFRRVFRHYMLEALLGAGVPIDSDTIAELNMAANALWLAMEKMIEGAIDEHKTEVKHG